MARKLEIPNLDDLVKRYRSGTSFLQLSHESGICRNVLGRRFRELDIPLRSQSEQEKLKWQTIKLDRAAVVRQMSRAWEGRRGSHDPLERRIRRAKTNYERLLHVGRHERALYEALRDRGMPVSQQTQVGTYNLDLSIDPPGIAVEVQLSWLRGGKSVRPQRLEYILDQGWTLVIIVTWRKRPLNISALADDLCALADRRSADPSLWGQYRVIDGEAQNVPASCLELHGRTVIL